MRPVVPFANVTIHDGLDLDGETHRKVRLTSIGNPATVVMYSNLADPMHWQPVDRLTEATVIETEDGYTITGTSDELVNVVGVNPSNAQVTWQVEVIGCLDCN